MGDFSSTLTASMLSLSEQKAKIVEAATAEKQDSLSDIGSITSEFMASQEKPVFGPRDYTMREESLPEGFIRGGEEAIKGMANTGVGLAAGAGAIAESALGEGGFSSQFKEAMVDKYVENQQDMSKYARPEDSLTYSYEKAKQGDLGAMFSWFFHGSGYSAAQLATILTGAGVIGKGVQLTGKAAVQKGLSSLVQKEAQGIAAKTLAKQGIATTAESIAQTAATNNIARQAVASVTKKLGQQAGMAAMSFGLEGGEIMGDLAHQSVERDKPLTGGEIFKGLTATAAAGSVEYMENLLQLKALKGKMGKGLGLEKVSGKTGKAARIGAGVAKTAPLEAGQEFVQTGIEQWGKGQDLNTEEAKRERIDAAGLGAIGGQTAVVGGAFSRSEEEIQASEDKRKKTEQDRALTKPETLPNHEATVEEAVESGNTEQFTNPDTEKGESFQPITAAKVHAERANKKDTSKIDKVLEADKLHQIDAAVKEKHQALNDKLDSLEGSEEGIAEFFEVKKEMDQLTEVRQKLAPYLKKAHQEKEPAPELVDQLKSVFKENKDEEIQNTILEMFGSNGGIDFASEDNKELDELLKANPNLSTKAKAVAETAKVYRDVNKEFGNISERTEGKTAQEVNIDIIEGNMDNGFMGISDHMQRIGLTVSRGKEAEAKQYASKFTQWANQRQERAEAFRSVYESNVNKAPVDEDAMAKVEYYGRHRKTPYDVGAGFIGTIRAMENEAAALQKLSKYSSGMVDTMFSAEPTQTETPVQEDIQEEIPQTEEPVIEEVPSQEENTEESGDIDVDDLLNEVDTQEVHEETETEETQIESEPESEMVPEQVVEEETEVEEATTVKLPEHISTEKQKALNAAGFTNKQISGMPKRSAQWLHDRAELSITEIEQEREQVKPEENTTRYQLYEELIAAKESKAAYDEAALPKELKGVTEEVTEESTPVEEDLDTVLDETQYTSEESKALEELKGYMGKREGVDSIQISRPVKESQKSMVKIGKMFGTQVHFFSSESEEINKNAGVALYSKDRSIFLNKDIIEDSPLAVLGHEITHQTKRRHPDLYKKLEDHLRTSDKEFTKYVDTLISNVKGTNLESEYKKTAPEEFISTFVGDQFGKKTFWENLQKTDENLFKKLVTIAKDIIDTVLGHTNRVEHHFKKDLEAKRKVVVEVMKDLRDREQAGLSGLKEGAIAQISSETKGTFDVKLATYNENNDKWFVYFKNPETGKFDYRGKSFPAANLISATYKKGRTKKEPTVEVNVPKQALNEYLTTREEPGNPLNEHGKVVGKPNIFNTTNSIITYIKSILPSTKDKDRKVALTSLKDFTEDFIKDLDNLYSAKRKDFHWEAPINYFADVTETANPTKKSPKGVKVHGVLPENVKSAMAATAFKWLATQGFGTLFNDERTIRNILGLPSSTEITAEAHELLSSVGVSGNYLSEIIGKEVFKNLQIELDENTPVVMQSKLEKSLGFMVLGNLQRMGYLTRTHIDQGTYYSEDKEGNKNEEESIDFDTAEQGLHGLANKIQKKHSSTIDKSLFNLKTIAGKSRKNRKALPFFKALPGKKPFKPDSKLAKLMDAYNQDREVWDDLFGSEKYMAEYSFTKFKHPKGKLPVQKGQEDVSEEQSDNLKQSMDTPYVLVGGLMNLLDAMESKLRNNIFGYVDKSKEHKDQDKPSDSVNRSIDNSWQNIGYWFHEAVKKSKKVSGLQFYIPAVFQANNRMRQVGLIQPQNDKIQRSLFSMRDAFVTFDPNSLDEANTYLDTVFKEVLGLSFGFESSKEDGVDSVIEKTEQFLKEPEVVAALKTLDKVLEASKDSGDYSHLTITKIQKAGANLDSLLPAVKMGGEKLHSLKGLLEYQRYVRAKKQGNSFKTDLFAERDGIANGPTMTAIQLTLSDIDATLLGQFTSEGLSFRDRDNITPADHKKSHDPYERIGVSWGNAINRIKHQLVTDPALLKKRGVERVRRINAITELLGGIYDSKGYLSKGMRKLSKNKSVGALYGSGPASINKSFSEDTLLNDVIITKLKEIANNPDKIQAAKDRAWLTKRVDIISGTTNSIWFPKKSKKHSTDLEARIRPDAVKWFNINVKQDYGRALVEAIGVVYGDMQEAREPLNKGISMLAARYNAAQKALIDQIKGPVTKGQLEEIREKLNGILPRVKTPKGNYLQLYDFIQSPEYSKAEEDRMIQNFGNKGFYNRDPRYNVSIAFEPKKVDELKNPGVKPVPTIIHMLDSMVANYIMEFSKGMGILNIHDASIAGIKNAEEVALLQNEAFYNIMKDYSVAEAVQQGIEEATKALEILEKGELKGTRFEEHVKSYYKKFRVSETKDEETGKVIYRNRKQTEKDYGKEIAEVTTITTKNKNTILNAVTYMNQYFDFHGGYPTGNIEQDKINGVSVAYLNRSPVSRKTKAAKENLKNMGKVEEAIKEVTKTEDELLYSKGGKTTLTENPADYAPKKEINRMSVVDLYDNIKNDSSISDSAEHDNHLRHILSDIVQTVINPIDLFLKTNHQAEAEGAFANMSKGKDRIFLSSQTAGPVTGALAQGIRMSTGEVYAHELVHAITHYGLKANKRLRYRAQRIYELTQKKLAKEYAGEEFKIFLNDPNMDITDPANFYEVEAAKERYEYLFGTGAKNKPVTRTNAQTKISSTLETSNYLDEFMAFGLTNQNFMNFLKTLELDQTTYTKSTWTDLKGLNIQETILNIGNAIFNFIFDKFTQSKGTGNVSTELEQLALQLGKIDSKQKTKAFVKTYTSVNTKISETANAFIKGAFKNAPVLKVTEDLKNLHKAAKESNSALGQTLRDVTHKYRSLDQGVIKSLLTEAEGLTKRMDKLHQLLTRRKMMLDTMKEAESANWQMYAKGLFSRDLEGTEKKALTKAGLMADTTSLLGSLSMNRIQEILTDKKALNKEIKLLLQKIRGDQELNPYAHYYERASSALGHFMAQGRSRQDEIVFLSTRVIAELENTKAADKLPIKAADKAEALVDKLASLYALANTSKVDKSVLADLIKEDSDAVRGMFNMHQELKEKSLKEAFNGNKYKFQKGYTKDILNTRINFQYGTAAEEAELKAAGFVKGPEIPRDLHDPTHEEPMFVYTAKTGRINDLVSAIASFTGNRAKGINSRKIAQQLGLDTAEGEANNKIIEAKKQQVLADMFKAGKPPKNTPGNYMVPQVDDVGVITGYRYMMSEETKANHLEKVYDFDAVLGSMAGQIVDKSRSPIINSELVRTLKGVFDSEFQDYPESFVAIGPGAEDLKLADIYNMFPEAMKKQIKQVWKGKTMYVPKDMVTVAFGYRQYSVVEAFAKKPADRARLEKAVVALCNGVFKQHGITVANNMENVAIELTKMAKNNIVVKSLSVTLGNFGSNIMYLKSRGVPIKDICKIGWEAVAMGTRYQADKQKLDQLEIKRKMQIKDKKSTKTVDNKIMQLKNTIARNPVLESIESGFMPSLVDDVETTLNNNFFPGVIEGNINKHKLPAPIQTLGKTAFLAEDTSGYKMLNNAVKMTDFVGRHVLYNYYVKDQKMDKQEAAAKAIDEFINFDVPTHKMVEYGNQIGLLWFTKYGTRVLKAIKNSAVEKPFEAFTAIMLATTLGWETIFGSIPGITKDFLSPLGNPISMFGSSIDDLATFSLFGSILD